MDLIFYLLIMSVIGLINVLTGDRSGGSSPLASESTCVPYEELQVGNNLRGIYHKDAFMKIVKELGLL